LGFSETLRTARSCAYVAGYSTGSVSGMFCRKSPEKFAQVSDKQTAKGRSWWSR